MSFPSLKDQQPPLVCVYLLIVLMYTCRGVDYTRDVSPSLFIKNKFPPPPTFSLDSCVLDRGFNGAMYINAELFTFKKDNIVYTRRLRFHGN